jgi:hypothetical protein
MLQMAGGLPGKKTLVLTGLKGCEQIDKEDENCTAALMRIQAAQQRRLIIQVKTARSRLRKWTFHSVG